MTTELPAPAYEAEYDIDTEVPVDDASPEEDAAKAEEERLAREAEEQRQAEEQKAAEVSAASVQSEPVQPKETAVAEEPPAPEDSIPTPVGEMVWLSATGEKYHSRSDCGRMNPEKARQVSLDDAISSGYDRCSKCW